MRKFVSDVTILTIILAGSAAANTNAEWSKWPSITSAGLSSDYQWEYDAYVKSSTGTEENHPSGIQGMAINKVFAMLPNILADAGARGFNTLNAKNIKTGKTCNFLQYDLSSYINNLELNPKTCQVSGN